MEMQMVKDPAGSRGSYQAIRVQEEEEQYPLCTYVPGGNDEDDELVVGSLSCPLSVCFVFTFLLIMLFFVFFVFFFLPTSASKCLPAPYLYVTSHGHHNIFKYTRDGCLVTEYVLKFEDGYDDSSNTYRGMTFASFGDVGE